MSNKSGFTMLEVIISISIGAIVMLTLFLIPRIMLTSRIDYQEEADYASEIYKIQLHVNRDIAAGNDETSNDNSDFRRLSGGPFTSFRINGANYEMKEEDGFYRNGNKLTEKDIKVYINTNNSKRTLILNNKDSDEENPEKNKRFRLEFPVTNDSLSRLEGDG